jgi:hypothetical protein
MTATVVGLETTALEHATLSHATDIARLVYRSLSLVVRSRIQKGGVCA